MAAALGLAGPVLTRVAGAGPDCIAAELVRQQVGAEGHAGMAEFAAADGHREGPSIENGMKLEFHAGAKMGAITPREARRLNRQRRRMRPRIGAGQ